MCSCHCPLWDLVKITPFPQEELQSCRPLGPRLYEHLLLFLLCCDCITESESESPCGRCHAQLIFHPHCSIHSLYALTLDFSLPLTIQAEASLTSPPDRTYNSSTVPGRWRWKPREDQEWIGDVLPKCRGRASTTRKKHSSQLKGNQVECSEGIGLEDTFS